ncbi:MAG: carbohydrate ABC transporter permease [Anaerolineales bacterium]
MKKINFSVLKPILKSLPYNLFVWFFLVLYLSPVFFMVTTAIMPSEQLGDKDAPLYPARITPYVYKGKEYQIYNVPVDGDVKHWALIHPGRETSQFIDPQHPEKGLITWKGNWSSLKGVYEFHIAWSNFSSILSSLPFPRMLRNTLILTVVGEVGVLISSIIVAYGFARFPLPGGNLLFYVLIATILIPEKITFIPTFFMYIRTLQWRGTFYPLLVHLFFGNAVYIFLLRQNFKSFPADLEEAAMLDGAGPLRRLFSIILPQSWHVVITVSLLHFFYTWNETRLASLYLGVNSKLMPISFAVQNFQTLVPIENVIEASTVIVLIVPVIFLFLAQKYFMQGVIVTGSEK